MKTEASVGHGSGSSGAPLRLPHEQPAKSTDRRVVGLASPGRAIPPAASLASTRASITTRNHLQPSRVGVLIANSQLRLLHCNAEAAGILSYPKKAQHSLAPNAALPASLDQLKNCTDPALRSGLEFMSGRRRYLCRAYLLDRQGGQGGPLPLIVAMLDRVQAEPLDITRWSEEFQLTDREREAVTYLLRGLSSREIAHVMHISPNTVKSFLKLVRVKVGAAKRAGIVAKIIDRLGPTWI